MQWTHSAPAFLNRGLSAWGRGTHSSSRPRAPPDPVPCPRGGPGEQEGLGGISPGEDADTNPKPQLRRVLTPHIADTPLSAVLGLLE